MNSFWISSAEKAQEVSHFFSYFLHMSAELNIFLQRVYSNKWNSVGKAIIFIAKEISRLSFSQIWTGINLLWWSALPLSEEITFIYDIKEKTTNWYLLANYEIICMSHILFCYKKYLRDKPIWIMSYQLYTYSPHFPHFTKITYLKHADRYKDVWTAFILIWE